MLIILHSSCNEQLMVATQDSKGSTAKPKDHSNTLMALNKFKTWRLRLEKDPKELYKIQSKLITHMKTS